MYLYKMHIVHNIILLVDNIVPVFICFDGGTLYSIEQKYIQLKQVFKKA